MAQMVFLSGFGCLARLVLIMAILCLFSQGQYIYNPDNYSYHTVTKVTYKYEYLDSDSHW